MKREVSEAIRLVKAGSSDEAVSLLVQLLSQIDTEEVQIRLTFRGIVGEVRITSTPKNVLTISTVKSSSEYADSLQKFEGLIATINRSVLENQHFLNKDRKPTPAQEMSKEDLIEEIGRIIECRMDGWIRVEKTPTLRLNDVS